jgi:hypothetical protein
MSDIIERLEEFKDGIGGSDLVELLTDTIIEIDKLERQLKKSEQKPEELEAEELIQYPVSYNPCGGLDSRGAIIDDGGWLALTPDSYNSFLNKNRHKIMERFARCANLCRFLKDENMPEGEVFIKQEPLLSWNTQFIARQVVEARENGRLFILGKLEETK